MTDFQGYARNGRVGIRDHVLILGVSGLIAPLARIAAERLAHPRIRVAATPYGSSHLGADAELHWRVLRGLACHPNCVGVVIAGSDPVRGPALYEELKSAGFNHAEFVDLGACGEDGDTFIRAIEEVGGRLLEATEREPRRAVDLSDLVVAIKDGRSDGAIGFASNPVVGVVVDRLVDAGATVIFGETIEWLGAEDILAGRAVNQDVAQRILACCHAREELAKTHGLDLVNNNPGPTNVANGLSTIEEKALGGIVKTGTAPILGVLEPTETPLGAGLYAMDTPAYAPECLTCFAAAGAHLVLFTTGRGNPVSSLLAPTIKVSGEGDAPEIDLSTTELIEGLISVGDLASRLFDLLTGVAGGATTIAERRGYGQEVIPRIGPTL